MVVFLVFFMPEEGYTQQQTAGTLSLSDVIQLAYQKSTALSRAKNDYLTAFWQYRSYKAKYLPRLELDANPIGYDRSVNVIYSVIDSINVITERQTFDTNFNLRLSQNIMKTGGTLFIDTDMSRTETILPEAGKQFASTPVRIGLNQPLFAYNEFKWEKKLEPIRFETSRRIFLRDKQEIAIRATELYFDLLVAEKNLLLAMANTANTDTLYQMGEKRFAIAGIEKVELNSLKLDVLKRRTAEVLAKNEYERTLAGLQVYVGLPSDQKYTLSTPEIPPVSRIDENQALAKAKANNPLYSEWHLQQLEAESEADRLRREGFSANLTTSFGLNDAEPTFRESFRDLNEQQRFSIGLSMPIIDWGQRKGRYKLSEKRLENVKAELAQNRTDMELDLVMTIREFNLQERLLKSASLSAQIASETYEMAKRRFLLGRGEVNTLATHLIRQDDAILNYVNVLRRYWVLYFSIRRDTLYDFYLQTNVSEDFNALHDF